jgi:hypothetical protein
LRTASELAAIGEKLRKLRRLIEARVKSEEEKSKLMTEVDRCLNALERILDDVRVENPELAMSLSREADKLVSKASSLPRGLEDFLWSLRLFRSHLLASYYDFSSKLTIVRRGYRLYVLSTVIAMILMPVFFNVGFFLLGIYVLGLMISIHAFRVRRKLGPLIAAALLPLALFTAAIALKYSIYALSIPAELARMVSESGLSEGTAKLILILIAVGSSVSLVSGFYALYVLFRHMDAFA